MSYDRSVFGVQNQDRKLADIRQRIVALGGVIESASQIGIAIFVEPRSLRRSGVDFDVCLGERFLALDLGDFQLSVVVRNLH